MLPGASVAAAVVHHLGRVRVEPPALIPGSQLVRARLLDRGGVVAAHVRAQGRLHSTYGGAGVEGQDVGADWDEEVPRFDVQPVAAEQWTGIAVLVDLNRG